MTLDAEPARPLGKSTVRSPIVGLAVAGIIVLGAAIGHFSKDTPPPSEPARSQRPGPPLSFEDVMAEPAMCGIDLPGLSETMGFRIQRVSRSATMEARVVLVVLELDDPITHLQIQKFFYAACSGVGMLHARDAAWHSPSGLQHGVLTKPSEMTTAVVVAELRCWQTCANTEWVLPLLSNLGRMIDGTGLDPLGKPIAGQPTTTVPGENSFAAPPVQGKRPGEIDWEASARYTADVNACLGTTGIEIDADENGTLHGWRSPSGINGIQQFVHCLDESGVGHSWVPWSDIAPVYDREVGPPSG